MGNEYSQAISETLELLKYMEDELLNKIPLDVIRRLKEKRDTSYIEKFAEAEEIDFEQVSDKAKNVLAVLYRDYIADTDEKIEFDRMIYENEVKANNQDYTIKRFENITNTTNENLPAITKKGFLQRLFEKIFKSKADNN